MQTRLRILWLAMFLLSSAAAHAGDVVGLTSFTSNTPALASEVNGNFDAVKTAVDDNAARVTTLEGVNAAGRLGTLEGVNAAGRLGTLEGVNAGSRLGTLEGVNAASRLGTIETVATPAGNLVLEFSTATTGNILKGTAPFLHNFGLQNTFLGVDAGNFTMTGAFNTASGAGALAANTTGLRNTASGSGALPANTTGNQNTAHGWRALEANTTGTGNTGIGSSALLNNTTGSFNTAIGPSAGNQLTTGDSNIAIANLGVAGDANTIRIGRGIHTRTFIGGIRGITTGVADAVTVAVDSTGQLGTVSSSRRVKDDIADMGAASSALMQLRPVTFHYKSDHNPEGRTLQYGLVAEEVAQVAPGLVARSANGEIETVYYRFLPSMLLNEYQKQQRTIAAQAAEIAQLKQQTAHIAKLEQDRQIQAARIAALEQQSARMAGSLARLERAGQVALADR